MSLSAKTGGAWKSAVAKTKKAGAWTEAKSAWVKEGGVWVKEWPRIGDAYGGGYYYGSLTYSDGVYDLIVAPKAAEIANTYAYSGSTYPGSSLSELDGYANTVTLAALGWPVATSVRGYAGGGFNDWYWGGRFEMELLYRNLKPWTNANVTDFPSGYNPASTPAGGAYTAGNPAMTPLALFQATGAQGLDAAEYWDSSVVLDGDAYTGVKSMITGSYYLDLLASNYRRVRPIRRIKV